MTGSERKRAVDKKCILLGVTGGIAAYKSADIARRLSQLDYRVKVVMTRSATQLVAPLTFRTLTGEPVGTSLFEGNDTPIYHISLAQEADLVLVAPATANILAKMALGIADDLLSTTLLATAAPIVVAPAMNEGMYRHPATQENLEILRGRGITVVGPETGGLACLDVGEGRMVEPEEIVRRVVAMLEPLADLAGLKILVTAGGTREPIDAVRYISNRSSGKMGYALAAEAACRGAEVLLISAPTSLAPPPGAETVRVETAAQMAEQVLTRAPDFDAVVMAAAVADFRPAETRDGKLKKQGAPLELQLERTEDILKSLGERKPAKQILVGFSAETENLLENARVKLKAKNLDLILANDVSGTETGFDADLNQGYLIDRESVTELPLQSKREMAAFILDRLRDMWAQVER